ncbi:hypothetical protein SAMN05421770_101823 [Granulicella rosea]|uniref:Uncharacterized protein n=1 Tax=Granulicella rosea TaxID=474952 RepID=A0A239E8E9_9BACT|nr:hypothetical protein [Granulicella rosea]SNS40202.1 hypothetical protein SAMN05421770_101823 [Granulicella rosea]
MKIIWFALAGYLLPFHLYAEDRTVAARIANVRMSAGEVTRLHLRPEFESTIHLPEDVTSVVLGDPGSFKAEHNEGEPRFVYVKPITTSPTQSNLLITTKSGSHVSLELISDGTSAENGPVDFLIEYSGSRSLFLPTQPAASSAKLRDSLPSHASSQERPSETTSTSALEDEFRKQSHLSAPSWTKWDEQRVQTSVGTIEQRGNEMAVSYSILNASAEPVEIVPPQIQMTGLKPAKKKQKKGKGIISDQLEIRDFKLSATRMEPGARVDGVVEFDRPNFKQSTEKLFLQIAQADQVDRPILIRLPFTAPVSSEGR